MLKQPPIKPFDPFKLEFPEAIRLSCDIPCHVIGDGEDEINRVSIYVRGGMIDDRCAMQSQFTASNVVEASETSNSEKTAFTFDNCGAWKSAVAHDDWSEIILYSLNSNFDTTFPLLCECIRKPAFNDQDFDLIKRRTASMLATSRQKVKYMAQIALRKMYYGTEHPLVADYLPEQVMAVETSQLREFYSQYYLPSQMKVVISGQITDREMKVLDDCLSSLDMKGKETPVRPWATNGIEPPLTSFVYMPNAVQSAISIAIKAVPRRHPDYLKLRIAVMALGGYFGSRLMSKIREEKGYTYGIYAVLSGREHESHIGISTECDARYTQSVIEEIKNEMQKMREAPISTEELNAVRQYMLSDLAKTLDTPFSKAGYVASTLLYGIYPDYFNRQVEEITQITPDEIMKMAQTYFDMGKAHIAIAGETIAMKR